MNVEAANYPTQNTQVIHRRLVTPVRENNNRRQRSLAYTNDTIPIPQVVYKRPRSSKKQKQEVIPQYVVPVMYVEQAQSYPNPFAYAANYQGYQLPPTTGNSYYVQLPANDPNLYQEAYDNTEYLEEYEEQDDASIENNTKLSDSQEEEEYEYYSTEYDTGATPRVAKEEQNSTTAKQNTQPNPIHRISRGSQTYLTDKNIKLQVKKYPPSTYADIQLYREQNKSGKITVATQTPDVKRILDALTAETKNIASKTNEIQDYDTIMKKVNKYFTTTIGNHLDNIKEQVNNILKLRN